MVLRGLALTWAVAVVALAVICYTPMPPSIDDRYRATGFLSLFKLVFIDSFKFLDMLGYGPFYHHIEWIQRLPERDRTGPPISASYGDLEVTRSNIEGVDIIVYQPKDRKKGELLPGLVYLHGGGWATYGADLFDRTLYEVAKRTKTVTISVDYRLAPQHPFPAGVEDCISITKYVLQHGQKLGIDTDRVGIGGDSAGGNLASAVSIYLTKHESSTKLPPLAYQAILWPVLQVIDFQLPSYRELGELMPLPTQQMMLVYWAFYLGLDRSEFPRYIEVMKRNQHIPPAVKSKYSKYVDVQNLPEKFRQPRPEEMCGRPLRPKTSPDDSFYDDELYQKIKDKITDPLFSPLVAQDLSGLPPALLVTSEFDILRDDGLLYGKRLREAGVDVEEYMSGGYHDDFIICRPDFLSFLYSTSGNKSLDKICDFINRNNY